MTKSLPPSVSIIKWQALAEDLDDLSNGQHMLHCRAKKQNKETCRAHSRYPPS